MAQRIEDYALIGDTHTAALVGRDGSIDWLCLPRFDSAAMFASLLGTPENGCWRMHPTGEVRSVSRRYRKGTLILETSMVTDSGAITLIDFMPRAGKDDHNDLIRIVRGERGEVRMRTDVTFRFDYGEVIPWVRSRDYGISAIAGPDALQLRTPVELHGENMHTVGDFTVRAGESVPFILTWHPSHLPDPPPRDPEEALRGTEAWWRNWSQACRFGDHPWADNVVNSLVVLKALTYSETGGMVAAPTTSLPEEIGGIRNWDYRYCWIRDATFTLYALHASGFSGEAEAWREWLLRAVAGDPDQLRIMYGVAGERRLPELELPHLPGYEDSRPVRVGNKAHKQFQLDIYGELMDAFHVGRSAGLQPTDDTWELQKVLLDRLETRWDEPDSGIWEVRGEPRHFTHSKVMAWVAFDRVVKDARRFGLDGPVERWEGLRAHMHREICRKGFDTDRNAFVQFYGSDRLDASLLMIPLVGFLPPRDPRVQGTIAAIQDELMEDGFVLRYLPDERIEGLQSRSEGAFLPCSFWLADCLAMSGRQNEARDLFERLLDLCNDVGLLPEEYDPHARRFLGNFPQAFSHVALVNTAHNLTEARGPAEQRAEE